ARVGMVSAWAQPAGPPLPRAAGVLVGRCAVDDSAAPLAHLLPTTAAMVPAAVAASGGRALACWRACSIASAPFSGLEKQMVSHADLNRWATRWGADRGGNRGQKHADENERVPGAKERARMARKYRKRDDGSLDWGHCASDP